MYESEFAHVFPLFVLCRFFLLLFTSFSGACPLIHPNYFSVYLGLGLGLGLGLIQ